MSNPQYIEIFGQKIQQFLARYYTARRIYSDALKDDKCYHNGEFGKNRENACAALLKSTICADFGISNGFILNYNGERTTECDIVVHNPFHHPLEDLNTGTQFFLAESVVAIGEVKSILNVAKLHAALNKLSENKKIRDALNGQTLRDARTYQQVNVETETHHTTAPFTFLICEKIEGFNSNLPAKITANYLEHKIPRHLHHNLILSLADGLFTYSGAELSRIINEPVGSFPYPKLQQEINAPQPICISGDANKNVLNFLINLSNSLQNSHFFYPEPTKYL